MDQARPARADHRLKRQLKPGSESSSSNQPAVIYFFNRDKVTLEFFLHDLPDPIR